MPFEVKPVAPGKFESGLNIFLDVGKLVTQHVSVRGTAMGEVGKE